MNDFSPIIHVAVAISTICGAWLAIRRVAKDNEKQRKHNAAEILQVAKEADSVLKAKFDADISDLNSQLRNLKEGTTKDIDHLRESHDSEFKHLAEKIENLRQELNVQHTNILTLLTKMIANKD